jgi:hypothetical protein
VNWASHEEVCRLGHVFDSKSTGEFRVKTRSGLRIRETGLMHVRAGDEGMRDDKADGCN